MAILNTPVQGLPYPDHNETIHFAWTQVRDLADALETKLVMVFASASARDSTLTGILAEGMLAWLQDVNQLFLYDGTTWQRVYPSTPTIFTGTTTPSSGLGSVGDIYVQYS